MPAGIAIAGAAVIAVAPIAPTLPVHVPDVHLPSIHQAEVKLTALTDPLQAWAQVVTAAISNIGQVGGELAANPAPIIQKIIQNQLANGAVLGGAAQKTVSDLGGLITGLPAILQTAAGQAAAGDIPGAVSGIISASLPSLLNLIDDFNASFAVVSNTAQNAANLVAATPALLLPTLLAVSGPVVSLANAGAATTQALVDALGSGDLEGIANALLNAPSTLVGAALNGFGNSPIGFPSAGLLSPTGALAEFTAGTISGLLALRNVVANALHTLPTPAAATAVNASVRSDAPTAALTAPAKTVTVSVPASAPTDAAAAKPSTTESHNETGSATGKSDSADTGQADIGKVDDTTTGEATKGGVTESDGADPSSSTTDSPSHTGSSTDTGSASSDTGSATDTGSASSDTGSSSSGSSSTRADAHSAGHDGASAKSSDSGAKSGAKASHKHGK
jgi:hypothetical protein